MRSKNSMEGNFPKFEPVDQEMAFLKSGYNSQSKKRFESYGLLKLGNLKFPLKIYLINSPIVKLEQ